MLMHALAVPGILRDLPNMLVKTNSCTVWMREVAHTTVGKMALRCRITSGQHWHLLLFCRR
jgi:hypothetical protein